MCRLHITLRMLKDTRRSSKPGCFVAVYPKSNPPNGDALYNEWTPSFPGYISWVLCTAANVARDVMEKRLWWKMGIIISKCRVFNAVLIRNFEKSTILLSNCPPSNVHICRDDYRTTTSRRSESSCEQWVLRGVCEVSDSQPLSSWAETGLRVPLALLLDEENAELEPIVHSSLDPLRLSQ